MEECEHIELTSDEPWDPTDVDWEENEEKFTQKHRHAWNVVSSNYSGDEDTDTFDSMEQAAIDDMLSDLPKVRTARYATRALRTGKRAEDVDYDRLRRIFGGVSEEPSTKRLRQLLTWYNGQGLCHYISDIRRSSNSFATEG